MLQRSAVVGAQEKIMRIPQCCFAEATAGASGSATPQNFSVRRSYFPLLINLNPVPQVLSAPLTVGRCLRYASADTGSDFLRSPFTRNFVTSFSVALDFVYMCCSFSSPFHRPVPLPTAFYFDSFIYSLSPCPVLASETGDGKRGEPEKNILSHTVNAIVLLLLSCRASGRGFILSSHKRHRVAVSSPSFRCFARFLGLFFYLFIVSSASLETAPSPYPSCSFSPLAHTATVVCRFTSEAEFHVPFTRFLSHCVQEQHPQKWQQRQKALPQGLERQKEYFFPRTGKISNSTHSSSRDSSGNSGSSNIGNHSTSHKSSEGNCKSNSGSRRRRSAINTSRSRDNLSWTKSTTAPSTKIKTTTRGCSRRGSNNRSRSIFTNISDARRSCPASINITINNGKSSRGNSTSRRLPFAFVPLTLSQPVRTCSSLRLQLPAALHMYPLPLSSSDGFDRPGHHSLPFVDNVSPAHSSVFHATAAASSFSSVSLGLRFVSLVSFIPHRFSRHPHTTPPFQPTSTTAEEPWPRSPMTLCANSGAALTSLRRHSCELPLRQQQHLHAQPQQPQGILPYLRPVSETVETKIIEDNLLTPEEEAETQVAVVFCECEPGSLNEGRNPEKHYFKEVKTVAEAMEEFERWLPRMGVDRLYWVLDPDEEKHLPERLLKRYRAIRRKLLPSTREQFTQWLGETYAPRNEPLPEVAVPEFYDDPPDAPWRLRVEETIRNAVNWGYPVRVRPFPTGFSVYDVSWYAGWLDVVIQQIPPECFSSSYHSLFPSSPYLSSSSSSASISSLPSAALNPPTHDQAAPHTPRTPTGKIFSPSPPSVAALKRLRVVIRDALQDLEDREQLYVLHSHNLVVSAVPKQTPLRVLCCRKDYNLSAEKR